MLGAGGIPKKHKNRYKTLHIKGFKVSWIIFGEKKDGNCYKLNAGG